MDTPASASPSCAKNGCDHANHDAGHGAGDKARCVNSGAPEGASTATENRATPNRHRQPGFGGTACGSRSTRPTGVR
jgi:hypothetical protein